MTTNEITMEIVRPGDTYGQLLSPLTDYVVLCGDECPVTLRITKKLEHWRLLSRLKKLRYYVKDNKGTVTPTPNAFRDEEIQTLGMDVGEIFAKIPTLYSEIGQCSSDRLTHLQMLISGSELALIPFELLVGPIGYPDTGNPLLLQKRIPLSITRGIRWGQPLPVKWDRKPRILFVSAAPVGLQVPLQEHVNALRMALDPWIKWKPTAKERAEQVKKHLTILPNASLEEITQACAQTEYTHIHILAHGAESPELGQDHFGVILCEHTNKTKPAVIDSRRFAAALRVPMNNGIGDSRPSVVTLSTCDSGNQGSVVAPGGSIAHTLHASGIPWVFASQFPLTKKGSIKITHGLYKRLLRGDSPVAALHDVRNTLYTSSQNDHDWASLIAYAYIPKDFQSDCNWFYAHQTRRACNEDLAVAGSTETSPEVAYERIKRARGRLEVWRQKLLSDTSANETITNLKIKGVCLGVSGTTEKQLAEVYYHRTTEESPNASNADIGNRHNQNEKNEKEALLQAWKYYKQAMKYGDETHWQTCQYLSLTAILGKTPDEENLLKAELQAKASLKSNDRTQCAWAHATLAEVTLLQHYHRLDTPGATTESSTEKIKEHLRQVIELKGKDSFHFFSVSRQFRRYRNWWKKYNKALATLAEAAAESILD